MSPKSRGRKNKKNTKRGGHPRRGGFAAAGADRPLSASGSEIGGRRAPATNSPWPDLQQMVATGVPALYSLAKRFRPLLSSDDLLAVEVAAAELITQDDQAEATSGLGLVMGW